MRVGEHLMGRIGRVGSWLLASLLMVATVWPGAAVVADDAPVGPAATQPTESLVDRLDQATEGHARISYHAQTGKVRFLGTDPEYPLTGPTPLQAEAAPEEVAYNFLNTYGSLFGLTNAGQELEVMRTEIRDRGRSFVRFQQVYQDIPILGGELIVQVNAKGSVISANGEILPDLNLDTSPTLEAIQAQERARSLVAKGYSLASEQLTVSEPELWIYNPILLKPGPNLSLLVWRMEVQAGDIRPVRELVLIEAHSGIVALHFSQIDTVKNRITYDNNNNRSAGLPGTGPVRTEGQAATGIADVDAAYDYAGDTYDFYSSNHSRDSIDGAGMSLISTVRYCPASTADPCPYPNAFWNGTQMVYGQGYAAADDVVAHELTHGVTEYESRLFYYMQSGAINEALSDIWGELVDLGNGAGNDSPAVRWQLGEDLPGGAGRDLSNPPSHEDPDKMTSSYYYCGEQDRGGVHSNSGVANKAAYLMVDGDTFNGRVITGIGTTKTAKIWYEVQSNMFTSASDYADLYDSLQQACTNLIGTSGITAANCQEVKDAVDATEMYLQPPGCPALETSPCSAGTPTDLFFDDMENTSSGNWTHAALTGTDEWYYPQTSSPYGLDATYATSGQYNMWGYGQPATSDFYIAMTTDIAIPSADPAYLHFQHAYAFEDYTTTRYDGGVLEYSTNGGTTWNDAGSLPSVNGYSGSIFGGGSNPLAGRSAFVGESNGYGSTRVMLSSLAGQSVRFRFRIGTDSSGDALGWFIDDVRIHTCPAVTFDHFVYLPFLTRNYGPPLPPALNPIANSDGDGDYTVTWIASSGATSYSLEEDDNPSFSSPTQVYSGPGTSKSITGQSVGTYHYRVNASNVNGTSGWSNTRSVVVSPSTGPNPGFWEGSAMEFYVTPDRANVDNFAIYIYVSECGYYKITHLPEEPIVDNYFSFGGSFWANGTFTSPTSCSGTTGLSSFYIPDCGYISGSMSYTATWQGSAPATTDAVAGSVLVAKVDEDAIQSFLTAEVERR